MKKNYNTLKNKMDNFPPLIPSLTLEQELEIAKIKHGKKDRYELVSLIMRYTEKVGKARSRIESDPSVFLTYKARSESVREYHHALNTDNLAQILCVVMAQSFTFQNIIDKGESKNAN